MVWYVQVLVTFFSFYLVEEGAAVGGVFGECRGPTYQGLVHAIAVVRHTHAPFVHVCLLLQQSTWITQEGGNKYTNKQRSTYPYINGCCMSLDFQPTSGYTINDLNNYIEVHRCFC